MAMALILPSVALSHPGHTGSWAESWADGLGSGWAHPLGGMDHVLAMVGVGLLAARLKGRWLWALPATFVLAMLGGAAGGAAGWGAAPWLAESGIAASVFAFGLLATFGKSLPRGWIAGATATFAILHGSAHGAEMPAGGSTAAYFVGFTLGTLALHAVGVGAGVALAQVGRDYRLLRKAARRSALSSG
jgi:urease accessory protein